MLDSYLGLLALYPVPFSKEWRTDTRGPREIKSRGLLDCKKGFPGGSVVKNLPADAGDSGSIPGSERSTGEGNSNPLQHPCLGNPMDRGTFLAIVHEVTKESGIIILMIKTSRP